MSYQRIVGVGNLGGAGASSPSQLVASAITSEGPRRPNLQVLEDMQRPCVGVYNNQGAVAGSYGAAPTNVPGVGQGFWILNGASSAGGNVNLMEGYNSRLGSFAQMRARIGLYLPALSGQTAGETFQVWAGSFQTAAAAPQGLPLGWMTYSDGVNGGRWQLGYQNGIGGQGTVDTGITVAANTFYIVDLTATISAPDTANNTLAWALYQGKGTAPVAQGSVSNSYVGFANGVSALLGASMNKIAGSASQAMWLDFWQVLGVYA